MTTSAQSRDDVRRGLTAAARTAHAAGDWQGSYAGFTAASSLGPLDTEDLASLAIAARRLGRLAESTRLAKLVFTRYTRRDPVLAGEQATELALAWLTRGDRVSARGWIQRARALTDGTGPGSGYLAYLEVSILADEHRVDDATAGTDELAALDDLLANPAVRALTLVARGRLALADDRADAGHRLLAQALVGADDPRVPIEWAGEVYGTALRHLRRDGELATSARGADAMDRWCERLGLGGLYRGWASHARGVVAVRTGAHRRAVEALSAALCEYRVLQPHRDVADAYEWRMMAHRSLGDSAAAEADSATAAAIRRLLGE